MLSTSAIVILSIFTTHHACCCCCCCCRPDELITEQAHIIYKDPRAISKETSMLPVWVGGTSCAASEFSWFCSGGQESGLEAQTACCACCQCGSVNRGQILARQAQTACCQCGSVGYARTRARTRVRHCGDCIKCAASNSRRPCAASTRQNARPRGLARPAKSQETPPGRYGEEGAI